MVIRVAVDFRPRRGGQTDGVNGELMNARSLSDAMAAKNDWTSPGGRTPHATLFAAKTREIKVKGSFLPGTETIWFLSVLVDETFPRAFRQGVFTE